MVPIRVPGIPIHSFKCTDMRQTPMYSVRTNAILAMHHSAICCLVRKEQSFVVGTGPENVEKFFGITDWPNKTVFYDLGNRNLTVIPIPGHTEDSITIYDPWTHFLLTGDSVYPGTLFIPDWMSFKQSINKLASFAEEHPISYILGTHIEMTATPGQDYSDIYEPNEHVLQLGVEHLRELRDSLEELGDTPVKKIHDDFIIFPRIFGEDAFGEN